MSGTITLPALIRHARHLAQRLLVSSPERWRHASGVARRAEAAAVTPAERFTDMLHRHGPNSPTAVVTPAVA